MNFFIVYLFFMTAAFGVEIYYLLKHKSENKDILNKLSSLSSDLQKIIASKRTETDQEVFVKTMIIDDNSEKSDADPNEKTVYDQKSIAGSIDTPEEKTEEKGTSLVNNAVTVKTIAKKLNKSPRKYQKKAKTVLPKSWFIYEQ